MYDETCKLREKRLDIEEALSEEKRLKDVLNKELDVLQKKAKVIVMSLKSAEDELEAFQVRSNSWIIWYNHDLTCFINETFNIFIFISDCHTDVHIKI